MERGWIVGAVVGKACSVSVVMCGTVMLTAVSTLSVTPLLAVAVRATVELLLCVVAGSYNLTHPQKHIANHWKLLLMRSTLGAGAVCLNFTSSTLVPLGKLGVLMLTQPIYTMLTSLAILRVLPSLSEAACCVLAIVGSFLIMQPPFVFGESESLGKGELIGSVILLTAMILFASSITFLRRLGGFGVPWTVVNGCHATMMLVGSVGGMLVQGELPMRVCGSADRESLSVVAVAGFLHHYCLFKAMKHENPTFLAIIMTSQVLLLSISEVVLTGKLPSYNTYQMIGTALSVASVAILLSLRIKQQADNQKIKPPPQIVVQVPEEINTASES